VLTVAPMNHKCSVLVLALLASACASTPAAPFDTLKASNLVAYRLQNYEPQTPPAGAAAATGALPFIPPEIQTWAQQAVPALQNMLPPGLLPQGLIPGLGGAAPQQAAAQAPRFHGFRILEQSAIGDTELKAHLGEIFGTKDSFQAQHAPCMYAEMGLSFASAPGAPTNDVLISFSCNQAQGFNFVWPHPVNGMTPEFVKELGEIVPKLFVGTTPAPAQPISML
jgi:hypothetical protein